MKEKKHKKGPAIAIIVLLLLIGIAGAGLYFYTNLNAYRLVEVKDLSGKVTLLRNDEDTEIYEGMRLVTNDKVKTGKKSEITLKVDSDKHIEAMEKTCFRLAAEGTSKKGYVKVKLIYGEVLSTIDEKLADKSEFIVFTPNATCAVRGTQFSVNYDKDTNTTVVEVFRGKVLLTTEDDKQTIKKNTRAVVKDDEISVYEVSEGEEPEDSYAEEEIDEPEEVEEFNFDETVNEASIEEEYAAELLGVHQEDTDYDKPDTVKVEDLGNGEYKIVIDLNHIWGCEGTGKINADGQLEFEGVGSPDGGRVSGWFAKRKNNKHFQLMFTSADSDSYANSYVGSDHMNNFK